MEFTLKTVVLLIVALIVALVLIALAISWGNGGTDILNSFYNWVSGGSK